MTPLQIALLNRWASYRVSVWLARACGWPKPRDAEDERMAEFERLCALPSWEEELGVADEESA